MALSAPVAAPFDPSQRTSPPVLLSKTCQNCFSLKIRCDRTQRTDICDRCARLGKHCVFRPARRRDNSAKRDSRIQALEQQVQDLLRTQPGSIIQQTIPEGAPSSASIVSSTPSSIDAPPNGDVIDHDILTLERAETLVELYKSDMMPHFPFIIVPAEATATNLRHESPFLFLSIISVASFHDLAIQEKLSHRFKYMVSEKVLLGGDDSLSLEYLQGLLIVLAWNQYHGRSKYYSQYLQLAVSIAVDMRLDRTPMRNKPSNPGSKRDPIANAVGTATWGAEEQRAAAGIFYISSTISKLFDKMNTFPCSTFVEEGCRALRQRGEFQTDKDLYHIIRLQRIIENIDTVADQSLSDADAQEAFLRTRSELEEFRMHLHTDVSDSHLLFMQFHTAKLFLYQVAFFERSLQHNPALHLNTLCEGLDSAKAFLDLYLWLPPKSEMALTNSEWIQLSFGVNLAAKFAIVSKYPSVEQQTRELRRNLNIDNVFRHLSLRIGALVGRASDGNKQKDIFYHYEQRVRKIQNWYERMVKATGSDSPLSQQASVSPPATGNVQSIQMPTQQMDANAQSLGGQQLSLSSTGYAQQQPMSFANGNMAVSAASMGLTPLSTSPFSSSYSPVPSIAFPDLMSAPGWDMPFTIPMDDNAWVFDVTSGYQGMNMASPPSDGTWGSPNDL
ncbi:hypothetical protein BU24DRAFT_446202 [Aaosphaeria arxii CBS 175.79]|uniref:Zn(2)-C6 fungal-type domain-containing protein n=1 Tax=Aaosphaeria arxii CBS 175.79 TaxID=1450172 RepID=A0A6A5Y6C4_9PLEO|nr:uncharacterized protein BU24DRAFT_446202 [Aaosphaeria arxii CBS 175.79]KAF2021112.1 hypothetical protein BU24DRAFT_446202 [Aaosphaeria arxii CBS 175.79]